VPQFVKPRTTPWRASTIEPAVLAILYVPEPWSVDMVVIGIQEQVSALFYFCQLAGPYLEGISRGASSHSTAWFVVHTTAISSYSIIVALIKLGSDSQSPYSCSLEICSNHQCQEKSL